MADLRLKRGAAGGCADLIQTRAGHCRTGRRRRLSSFVKGAGCRNWEWELRRCWEWTQRVLEGDLAEPTSSAAVSANISSTEYVYTIFCSDTKY
ncbi:hypothetical protein AKJ16_DCAP00506 [Drosera capensis]